MSQPVDPMSAVSFVSLAVLCVLGLRKIVLMDGLLELRAVVLSALLWVAVFYLFTLALPASSYNCIILDDAGHTYTISE